MPLRPAAVAAMPSIDPKLFDDIVASERFERRVTLTVLACALLAPLLALLVP